MKAEIITIGDELLIGQVINTNQAYIAEQLNGVGVQIGRMTTVGDNQQEILDAFSTARDRNDIVVVTGGLGPTHDDVTKKTACIFFDSELVSSEVARRGVERLLSSRNIAWSPTAEEQTMVPEKARIIPNLVGTASGMHFESEAKHFFILPGVPHEMKSMMQNNIIPFLEGMKSERIILHRTLRTTGIPESALAAKLGNLDELLEGASLAFLPSLNGVRMRISVSTNDRSSASDLIGKVESRLRAKVQKYVYGVAEEELEDVIGMILTERRLTLSVAESCTGGLIADRITNVSGSSAYFERGVVTYSNKSKSEMLGVNPDLISKHGAVSESVAIAMAEGVRRISGTDIGMSVTGIAGPTGGTPDKPIGLVWVGFADAASSFALKFNFGDTRRHVKERASQAVIELLRRKLLNIE